MDVGMLWFDGDGQRDVRVRIERASEYYRLKYGKKPNLCFIHPTMAEEALPKEIDGLRVMTNSTVLPNHFWLGVERIEQRQLRSSAIA